MDDNKLVILIPSSSHIEELKQKGIDIETELARVVFDNLNLIKQGQNPKTLGISVTREQMNDLAKYGIDGPGYISATFKKELHERLVKK
jgi:hypothetical protein